MKRFGQRDFCFSLSSSLVPVNYIRDRVTTGEKMISLTPARSVFHILALNLESFLPVVGQDSPDQSIADLVAGL